MSVFDYAIALILDSEGGYTDRATDPGNWTGKSPGKGELKGTKFGISAASYPQLNIRELTLDEAKAIYKRYYWDVLPPGLDDAAQIVALDISINSGPGRVAGWVREGYTSAALLTARRLEHYTSLSIWPSFSKGWARRAGRTLEAAERYREV